MNYKDFLKLSEPGKNEIWADVGCGPGYFTIPLAEKAGEVIAVDISEEMLQICRRRADGKSLENIKYIKSNGDAIPLKDAAADKILLANIFHEFNDKDFAVKEIGRILRPDGIVFLIDWINVEMDFGPPLNHRLAAETVKEIFKRNGFSLIGEWDVYEYNYVLGFKK